VLAEVTVREETLRRVLRTSARDMAALEHLGLHGSHASGMQSVAFTPASAVAALFAATGQDLGMVGTSSMAHDVLEPVDGASTWPSGSRPGGGHRRGGTGLRTPGPSCRCCAATGPGGAQRLAQLVAAAALCLELSAAASASMRGSESFARAHLKQSGRGGLDRRSSGPS